MVRLSLPAFTLLLGVFSYGPAAQGSKGELAAKRSQQLGLTEGGLAYPAAVARYAGCASPQQPIGLHKPLVRVQIPLNPLLHLRRPLGTRISETCLGLCDMSGGITSNARVTTNIVISTVDQQDETLN